MTIFEATIVPPTAKDSRRRETRADEFLQLLYNQGRDARFTQDSPALPDVWIAYGEHPSDPIDVLLTPFQAPGAKPTSPSQLAGELHVKLKQKAARSPAFSRGGSADHQISVNQTTVAVRLQFDELVRVVLPMSSWWQATLKRAKQNKKTHIKAHDALKAIETDDGREKLAEIFARSLEGHPPEMTPDVYWMMTVIGAIALRRRTSGATRGRRRDKAIWPPPRSAGERKQYYRDLFDELWRLFEGADVTRETPPLVYLVSLNRPVKTSLFRSVPACKADAAAKLFNIDCRDITWAIVDSGIDARHTAFGARDAHGTLIPANDGRWADVCRIRQTYDFTLIRRILSTTPGGAGVPPRLKRLLNKHGDLRKEIRSRLLAGREIDWPLLLPFIEISHDGNYTPPVHDHGTHVAGIVGADWRPEDGTEGLLDQRLAGMCPSINLIDVRIIDDDGSGDEFTVMAALQFLRYLNSHKDFMVVHGVNLSLSIRHEVRNYACGCTPICEECDRLVASGLVVVAAAGNEGFLANASFATGREYQDVSITDPGNAESVITVGATHKDMPHTYGVSYFSSRGPTGDGRIKPDLVAPGEKIDSVAPDGGLARKDGTSMASPHVSGAAALLMARHTEFVGQPQRVKEVLCKTATDLGRERYFQGHGMLDVLRALQSV